MKSFIKYNIILFSFGFMLYAQQKEPLPLVYENSGFLPKITFGYHHSISTSIGLIYCNTRIYNRGDSSRAGIFSSAGAYVNAEVLWAKEMLYGGTIGVEVAGIGKTMAYAFGIELLYLQNKENQNSISWSPKIGIPMGFVNFYYAYQFGMKGWVKNEIGRHRFTLSINLDFDGLGSRSDSK